LWGTSRYEKKRKGDEYRGVWFVVRKEKKGGVDGFIDAENEAVAIKC
jgi:hypothetical protein